MLVRKCKIYRVLIICKHPFYAEWYTSLHYSTTCITAKNECQNSKVCFHSAGEEYLQRTNAYACVIKRYQIEEERIPKSVLFTLFYKSLYLFLFSPRTSSERKFKWTRELSLATITKFTRQSNENFACLVGIDRQVFHTPFAICLSVGFQTTTWKTLIFWLYVVEHHVNLIYLVGLDILLIVFCFPFVGFRREKGLWSC